MKFRRIGALSAVALGTVFAACSSDQDPGSEGNSSVGFELVTMEGVEITEVLFDLNTQAGADVIAGTIPVPNDDSVIDGFLGALAPADYALSISATGTYQGDAVSCVSDPDPTNFSLAPSQELTLPAINLVCTVENVIGDETGSVSFGVDVTVEQIDVVQQVVETFSITPVTAVGTLQDDVCTFPPMNLQVENSDVAISYSWTADPDGTFSFSDATNTSGTYTCQSNGTKTLTVTATLGEVSASKEVLVTCTGDCDIEPTCGNGEFEPDLGEECDEDTARCTDCVVTPVCNDGVQDDPEQCDEGGDTETCVNCQIVEGDECMDCVNAETAVGLGEFNQSTCEPLAGCPDVRDCVLDAGCYNSLTPHECYCGIGVNVDDCAVESFVPTGPCEPVIRANAGSDSPNNSTILDRHFDPTYPLGIALLLVDTIGATECSGVCGL